MTFSPGFKFQFNTGWTAFRFLPPPGYLSAKRLGLAGAAHAAIEAASCGGGGVATLAQLRGTVTATDDEDGLMRLSPRGRLCMCSIAGVALTGGKW